MQAQKAEVIAQANAQKAVLAKEVSRAAAAAAAARAEQGKGGRNEGRGDGRGERRGKEAEFSGYRIVLVSLFGY